MAGTRFSMLKSLTSYINPSVRPSSPQSYNSYLKLGRFVDQIDVKLSHSLVNNNYHRGQSHSLVNSEKKQLTVLGFASAVDTRCHGAYHISAFSPASTKLYCQSSVTLSSMIPFLNHRSYSSFFGGKSDKPRDVDVPVAASGSEVDVNDSGIIESNSFEKIKDVWQSVLDGVAYTGEKVKEASDELTPYVQQLLDAHPYLRNVVFPVSGYLMGTILAWVVMPRILRRFYKYAMQGPATLLHGGLFGDEVPFEKSFWGALEDPVRYLITFMAFVQIGMMIAPTTIASQYLSQAWRGAVILSFVWFLHRWKTNIFARALTSQSLAGIDRDKLLTLDKVSSVGLFVIGIMALAEACGIAVQSVLTVGGIGGVATAFAARDVLGNVLSGLSMQFSKPFSLGDTIKAGSIEGQVVEMGLTATTLLNAEKFPVLVPNSMFSSQVIVNKSRAQWRAIALKIPVQIGELDKIPQISNEIKSMLRSNNKVFLGREAPYCFLSQIESSFAELTLGCNLKSMSKDELYNTEQDILLQSVKIIKQHGASLGSTYRN